MNRKNIYLDNAATGPLSETMKESIISMLDIYGNPSSLYKLGTQAKQIISEARKAVAEFMGADVEDIYFTPGGAASNTFGIRGYYQKHDCCILYCPTAHKSVLECVKRYRYAFPLKVDCYGQIDWEYLKEWLDTRDIKSFVVMEYANSEIGTIQDIKKLIDLIHFYNGVVYLDCTGSIPSIPLDVKKLNIDICGFSGHKLGGLKGCGVFYKKKKIELEPLIYGSQEKSYVGGTSNLLGITSLGMAVKEHDYASITSENRDYVYNYIAQNIPDSYLVGTPIESGNRLPHNLYMCFRGIEAESLMILLDMNGIQVSIGSACNNGDLSASPTLTAIGMKQEDIHSCIRMTFSGRETKEGLDYVCRKLSECVESLRSLNTP